MHPHAPAPCTRMHLRHAPACTRAMHPHAPAPCTRMHPHHPISGRSWVNGRDHGLHFEPGPPVTDSRSAVPCSGRSRSRRDQDTRRVDRQHKPASPVREPTALGTLSGGVATRINPLGGSVHPPGRADRRAPSCRPSRRGWPSWSRSSPRAPPPRRSARATLLSSPCSASPASAAPNSSRSTSGTLIAPRGRCPCWARGTRSGARYVVQAPRDRGARGARRPAGAAPPRRTAQKSGPCEGWLLLALDEP
jgi:hypothetical protein